MYSKQVVCWFYTVLGSYFIIIRFYKQKKEIESRFLEWLPKQISISAMIIVGIIVFAIEFTTALPYIYSVLLMDGLAFNIDLSISILVGYNGLMVLPSILLLFIVIVFNGWVSNTLVKLRK